ncbi:MAG: hypothetical protein NTW72_08990 [Gemmatimonadetes bacterium]|nr:hypothetical protein [Gemmatimonadota bacterium]
MNCWPSACAALSVHCSHGASTFSELVRMVKLLPVGERMLNCAPLKPPRETSYGAVDSELDTPASRGTSAPPNEPPLSVVAFWSGDSPSTEKPDASPLVPGTSVTPGSDDAMAARLPASPAATLAALTFRSVPEISGWRSSRLARVRSPAFTRTASSSVMARDRRASAMRIS